jgi:transaldolase
MSTNPLRTLTELGQSVWYDYIRRDLYQGEELRRLIEEDWLRGMTSNPTIFQQAIAASELYDDDIRRLGEAGKAPAEIFEALEVEDVSRAADAFRGVYDATGGNDGFVSIEVGPHLARDIDGSIAEARRLWQACARPNVMVKIPGTVEGLAAIRHCLSEGININVTLLFSIARYHEVMLAYIEALEARAEAGQPIDKLRSVASFFVSRVDTNVDKKLDAIAANPGRTEADRALARGLRGKLAIANARLAYRGFAEVFGGTRFGRLQESKGAAVQRPLWASTSAKDPAYPPLYYVEALIAPDSVDTMPRETFDAYRKSGDPKVRIDEDILAARAVFAGLLRIGIDERQVYEELEEEGLKKFSDSYDNLLTAVEQKEKAVRVS